MTAANHYETLGVGRDATAEDIRIAYRSMAQRAHPDKESGSLERMQALNEARDTLLDDERRKAHDDELAGGVLQIDRLARECLIVHFRQIIDGAAFFSTASIIARVSADLANALRTTQARHDQAQQRREALLKRRRRVRTKGGAENLFHALIDNEVAGLDAQIESLARVLEVYPVCDQLLRSYEEEAEQPESTAGAFDPGLRQLLRGLHGDGMFRGGA